MKECGILGFLYALGVEHADIVSEPGPRPFEELKVGLNRVHGDEQVTAVGSQMNVLQTDECLSLLRLPNDCIQMFPSIRGIAHLCNTLRTTRFDISFKDASNFTKKD